MSFQSLSFCVLGDGRAMDNLEYRKSFEAAVPQRGVAVPSGKSAIYMSSRCFSSFANGLRLISQRSSAERESCNSSFIWCTSTAGGAVHPLVAGNRGTPRATFHAFFRSALKAVRELEFPITSLGVLASKGSAVWLSLNFGLVPTEEGTAAFRRVRLRLLRGLRGHASGKSGSSGSLSVRARTWCQKEISKGGGLPWLCWARALACSPLHGAKARQVRSRLLAGFCPCTLRASRPPRPPPSEAKQRLTRGGSTDVPDSRTRSKMNGPVKAGGSLPEAAGSLAGMRRPTCNPGSEEVRVCWQWLAVFFHDAPVGAQPGEAAPPKSMDPLGAFCGAQVSADVVPQVRPQTAARQASLSLGNAKMAAVVTEVVCVDSGAAGDSRKGDAGRGVGHRHAEQVVHGAKAQRGRLLRSGTPRAGGGCCVSRSQLLGGVRCGGRRRYLCGSALVCEVDRDVGVIGAGGVGNDALAILVRLEEERAAAVARAIAVQRAATVSLGRQQIFCEVLGSEGGIAAATVCVCGAVLMSGWLFKRSGGCRRRRRRGMKTVVYGEGVGVLWSLVPFSLVPSGQSVEGDGETSDVFVAEAIRRARLVAGLAGNVLRQVGKEGNDDIVLAQLCLGAEAGAEVSWAS
ncbi:hypothetical protein ACSSS7_007389 [Eimeria intestinalis]